MASNLGQTSAGNCWLCLKAWWLFSNADHVHWNKWMSLFFTTSVTSFCRFSWKQDWFFFVSCRHWNCLYLARLRTGTDFLRCARWLDNKCGSLQFCFVWITPSRVRTDFTRSFAKYDHCPRRYRFNRAAQYFSQTKRKLFVFIWICSGYYHKSRTFS